MSETSVPIILDKGLDTVTHPTLAEAGTLVDCLNYEMAGKSGYRRIEGFERYDGWFNGDIADYYIAVIDYVPPLQTALTVGATLWSNNLAVGVVVFFDDNLSGNAGTLYYVPINRETPLLVTNAKIDVDPTLARGTVTGTAVKASATVSPDFFLQNIRSYSSSMRNLVQAQQTPVAGIHWFRNNLILALDCPVMTYTDTDSTSRAKVDIGSIISYGGIAYRVVHRAVNGNDMKLHIEPMKGGMASENVLRVQAESLAAVLHTPTVSNLVITYNSSDYAYLAAAKTPMSSASRGNRYMIRTVTVGFSNGVAAAATDMAVNGFVGVGVVGGKKAHAMVKHVEITSGTFAAGTAAGYIELIFLDSSVGTHTNTRDFITTADDVVDASALNKYADITSVVWSSVPGTNVLRSSNTRYQWITANFYGQEETTEAYGATGASRGFWAQAHNAPITYTPPPSVMALDDSAEYSWGNVYTDRTNAFLDKPKYVAFHAQSLAFGIFGSVVRSVSGEPRLFSGDLGASETATGDTITGLLEAQNDTLIVLGRKAVRRLTGSSVSNLSLKTISSGSGAFDYTGVIVGSQPVYTGPAGITTLAQAETYGDFAGSRLTAAVSNTLVPKLITDWTDTEPGGVIMALPIRKKDQYRLWLSTGEVYTVSFTVEGPKIMKSNYGFSGSTRVPMAWTSEIADSGKEHTIVSWDDKLAQTNVSINGTTGTIPNPRQLYELERGWGFDGLTFSHYFDLAHTFGDSQAITISQVRLHGWSYGLATLDVKSASVEDDYDQSWHSAIQDISLPKQVVLFSPQLRPATSIVDQANWGLGVKLRINGTLPEGLTTTEPNHICQVLVLQAITEGAKDN